MFWMLGGAYSAGVDYSSERAAIRRRVSELVRSIVGDYIMDVHPRLVRCVFATADDAAGNGVLHTWLLPVAYNLGISLASGRYLLKLDADNILSQGFFNNIELQQWILYRGLWCSGAEHLNGGTSDDPQAALARLKVTMAALQLDFDARGALNMIRIMLTVSPPLCSTAVFLAPLSNVLNIRGYDGT